MENITKALLIAAGVLLAVMILSLLVIFGGQISGYFSAQHENKIIEQDAEFNAKFENYNGQTIRGNELISVMNKVVNYNTSIVGIEGDYDKVIMSVDFKGYQNSANNNFKYSSSDRSIFEGKMNGNILKNTTASDNNLEKITNLSSTLISGTGLSDTQLQRLTAEIQNIAIDEQLASNRLSKQEKDSLKDTRIKKLQNILGASKTNNLSDTDLTNIVNATKKYYQYTQLKRAMFKCTSVTHNTNKTSARVNGITFVIVEENGNAKFD